MDAAQWNAEVSAKGNGGKGFSGKGAGVPVQVVRAKQSASQDLRDAMQALEESRTAVLSNTVCMLDPRGSGAWPALDQRTMEEFTHYGAVARIDMSLAVVLKCVLVTYFDVRSAQQVLHSMHSRAEPAPPAGHDCRIVRVKKGSFFEKCYSFYGEVAFMTMVGEDTLVEYYDFRSAQILLAHAGGTASPFMPPSDAGQQPAGPWPGPGLHLSGLSGTLGAAIGENRGSISAPPGLVGVGPEENTNTDSGPSTDAHGAGSSPTTNGVTDTANSSNNSDSNPDTSVQADWASATKNFNNSRFTTTKVSGKEFSKYDIDLDMILRGEDMRTTCMVRNLMGHHAPDEFHRFLEHCQLSDRFTFFYMPCKERKKTHTGFAFINFATPVDVYKLCMQIAKGEWVGVISTWNGRGPEVSYARFQGHEQLAAHFSSSAVIYSRDPNKRPIFRLEVLEAAKAEMILVKAAKEEASASSASSAGGGSQKWSAGQQKQPPQQQPQPQQQPPQTQLQQQVSMWPARIPTIAPGLSMQGCMGLPRKVHATDDSNDSNES